MKRSPVAAGGNLLFGRACLLERQVASQRDISVESRAQPRAAVKIALGEFHGRQDSRSNAFAQFTDREKECVFGKHHPGVIFLERIAYDLSRHELWQHED